jgi:hypothetical protein
MLPHARPLLRFVMPAWLGEGFSSRTVNRLVTILIKKAIFGA